ncbi:MAG: hypothetical protein LBD23_01450 [Oscillospiraceae bacterium]|jgi:hypothetical protein|nr:hypothetical protein [Oscillospiraceae bacterium]
MDKEDLVAVADKVDWDLLDKLAKNEDELKSNIMNEKDYFFFMEAYKEYIDRWKP